MLRCYAVKLCGHRRAAALEANELYNDVYGEDDSLEDLDDVSSVGEDSFNGASAHPTQPADRWVSVAVDHVAAATQAVAAATEAVAALAAAPVAQTALPVAPVPAPDAPVAQTALPAALPAAAPAAPAAAPVAPPTREQADAYLATQGIVAHYDPDEPGYTGRWYVVTRGRTVGVFRNQ